MALQMENPTYGMLALNKGLLHSSSRPALPEHEFPSDDLFQLLQSASRFDAGITIYAPGLEPPPVTRITYKQLLAGSEEKASCIRQLPGLATDTVILLHFDSHTEKIEWFWAVVRSGFLPAISTPFSPDAIQREKHLQHLKGLLKNPVFLTSRRTISQFPEVHILSLHTVESLASSKPLAAFPVPSFVHGTSGRPAVLMLTSGSTGNAKTVPLTITQIVNSIRGKSENWGSTASSVLLSWIGLDHVANLTEIHLHAMFLGAEQVQVQANDLLAEPVLFLRLITRHTVTHTFAPNFFLAQLERRIDKVSDLASSIDLSCLRSIMSGGEANVVQTAIDLTKKLNALGAKGQIIRLGYGLTEACAALMYDVFDPAYEERERHEFASIGKPIRGANARICTDLGETAKMYEVGSLEISGPVLFSGYYNDSMSTAKVFTSDGWFVTGDKAYIDSSGKVNMSGRAKEVIVINGVKLFPQDLETALEKADIPGIMPSYIAAFPYRQPGDETERYCILYGCASGLNVGERQIQTIDSISKVTSALVGVRPEWIIPLPQARLSKSSLGKLSRTKLQADFEHGIHDEFKVYTTKAILKSVGLNRQMPETETESKIVQVLSEVLELPAEAISVDRTIFELGITSVRLFRFEQSLRKCLEFGYGISIITFLSNPIIREIANAIDNQNTRQYDPVVQLQARGTKSPLWLVHPASGNVLAFLPLARTVIDRPLYGLTAKGLGNNETLFESIAEMSDTYYQHLKQTHPNGPYALTGYSLGTTVAFELAKRLEANGDKVAFLGALDSPPHVIPLVEHLDWTAAAVLVSYFIELISQVQVPDLITALRGLAKKDTIQRLLEIARPEQRAALNLDVEQLLAIVNVTDNFGTIAKQYHPEGSVGKVDVFYCTPLHSVEKNREKWITDHLLHWQDFSQARIELHECEGDHADMLNPTYVEGFEQRLNRVLTARGI